MAIEKRIGAYSAYAIAVENGFQGTVEEWLESLIGPRGYQGWGVSAVNVSADGSLIFTIKNPETGETRELEPIQIETLNALNSISTAKDKAVNEVKEAQTQATEAVDTAGNQALQDISDAKTSATSAVNTAGENAVNSVNTAGTQAASDAQTAITAAKNQAVSGVESAGQSAVDAVGEAQTAGVQAVDTAKNSAVQAVQNAGAAEAEKISSLLPVPTEADAGKVPVAKPDGSGYKLGEAGVQIDDTKTALDTTWSSERIVSRLCPPFEVSDSIVTCQPVEGSTLNTVVQIEPVQEGTGDPSPENVRPIKGFDTVNVWRGKKNLLEIIPDGVTSGATVSVEDDAVTISATALGGAKYAVIGKFDLIKDQRYIISTDADPEKIVEYALFRKNSQPATVIMTLPKETTILATETTTAYLAVYISTYSQPSTELYTFAGKYQVELGSAYTVYEPYCGEIFEIPLGQTVYGGTLDVGSGVLTVDRVLKTLSGSEKWLLNFDESKSLYWHSIILYDLEIVDYLQADKSVSSHFKYGISTENGFWVANLGINLRIANNISTTEEWKDYLISENSSGHPVQVVYYIATPVTLQLTPQEILALSGENTVYADTGNVTVSGYSDPTTIIKNLTDRIAALEQNAIGG